MDHKEEGFPDARALPSRTPDLTHWRQNGSGTGRLAPPTPFRPLDGAPVASLRSRILRPGAASIGRRRSVAKERIARSAAGRV
jgi:hypothetical protein